MLEKMNKKSIKVIISIFVTTCIVAWYFYLIRPVGLYDVINKSAIKEIYITTDTSPRVAFRLPKELRLDNEQDINAIMNILNKYRYSKILKFYNPRVVPANPTNGAIDMFITYLNTDLVPQYIFVDTENDVTIRNKNNINIDCKIEGSDKRLFEDLSSWLSERQ